MRISTTQLYRNGLFNMLEQQQNLLKTQQQISTGKRVQTPSDDPIAAARIDLMKQRISLTERYQANKDGAENALNLSESILRNTSNAIQRLKELQIQAGDGALSGTDRAALSEEASEILDELVGLANFQDVNGHYIYSGSQTFTEAVSLVGGNYVYNGDDVVRNLDISSGLNVQASDTGKDIFMAIKNGNGTFQTNANPANTGTAVISEGSVTDFGAYIEDTYTVSFAAGNYTVTGAVSGVVAGPAAYTSGEAISFNGVTITIEGAPTMGADTFTVQPSTHQSIFATIQDMVTNLAQPQATANDLATIQNENINLLGALNNALDNVVNTISSIGARLNVTDKANAVNEDFIFTSKTTLSFLEDTDLTETAVKLQRETVSLQAAQQSFIKIQELNLFDYI